MSGTTQTLDHHTVTLSGGLRVHAVERGDPGGPAVALVHGWPDSWFSWSRVLAHLDPRLRAVAYSQRGFGESDHPAGGYTLDRFADDLLGLCDALGLERAHLVGHSFGSFVVRRVAEEHPDRVDRMVLIGSADRMGDVLVEEVRAAIADLPEQVPDDFAREFAASTVYREVAPDFFDALVAESRKAPGSVDRDSWEGLVRVDDRDRLRDVTAPMPVLWGDSDALFDRGQQDRLLAALPTPGCGSARTRGTAPTGSARRTWRPTWTPSSCPPEGAPAPTRRGG